MTREQVLSGGSVIALALALPVLLKVAGGVQRLLVGAEGRLAAITVETGRPLGPLPQPWRALAQGGEELKTFLDGETATQVAAIKPNLIRFDHIYDGFNVVSRSGNRLIFNWGELDLVVDKIRKTGASPFFSLSYMPLAISKGDIVDEPRDWNEWALVVERTIEHYSGEKKLAGVYYEVWNEPDLFGKWKMGSGKDYLKLYTYAVIGAQRASGVLPFKIGGPATTGLYRAWVDRFFPYVLRNNLRLDFVTWHRYTLDINQYSQDVASVERWLDSHPYFNEVEKIVSEMGPSSDKAAVNNSMLGAVHLLTTVREGLYKIKYMFNFSIKDAVGSKGGWGIIGKPRYDALAVLNKLGDQRLVVTGEGTNVKAMAAQKGDVYQVLVFNYDPKGIHTENVPVTFMNLKDTKFKLTQSFVRGATIPEDVATTEAILQTYVKMLPNSAVLVELKPITSQP